MRFLATAALAAILTPALAFATDFPLTGSNTTIGFLGTKPGGGKHDGGFKTVTGTASVTGTDAATLKITLDIDMESLYSDNAKLTNHLKSPDFFGVKSNPKSKFVTSKVVKDGDDYKVTGTLTMLGKDKEITFPAKIAVADGSLTVTSSFSIDRTQWGMTYGQGKVDNTVKLNVSVKAKS
jgi:polyisoprenoid-binding protein YceI